jgi:hypothetical protein
VCPGGELLSLSVPLFLLCRCRATQMQIQAAQASPRSARFSVKAYQTIVITGSNFGVNPPFNGCPDHMRVTDVTTNWSVPAVGPFGGCQDGIYVSSCSDNMIVIEGFPSFQKGQDALKVGDVIDRDQQCPTRRNGGVVLSQSGRGITRYSAYCSTAESNTESSAGVRSSIRPFGQVDGLLSGRSTGSQHQAGR